MFVCPPNDQIERLAAGADTVRHHNLGLVLRQVFESGPLSRADLARHTGLSRSTVSELVGTLIDQGLIEEAHRAKSSGGRPGINLRFRSDAGYVLGIALAPDAVTVVVTDLTGNVLISEREACDVQNMPEQTLSLIPDLSERTLAKVNVSRSTLAGVGVAVPCPVRPDRPDQLSERILPAWRNVRLGARLHQAFGVPVIVDNDANLGALAEAWWGNLDAAQDFAYVSLGTGVGAGLMVDGEIYRGHSGIAGEIGHTSIDLSGPLCRCGLHGCLEAIIGTEPLLDRYPDASNPEQLALRAHTDPVAAQVIAEAGRHLGVAMANLVNLLNPRVLVLSGPLTLAGDLLLGPLEQTLSERALWTSLANTRVVVSDVGGEAMARGAVALVIQQLLDNPLAHPLTHGPVA